MKRTTNYVAICPSDNQMDRKGQFDLPMNVRPQKCHFCTFPDLDHVPQVYLIGRGITRPGELDMADLGNFFARDRARKVIEVVCPGQCEFHPTFDSKTKEPTPWWISVPARKVADGSVPTQVPRCPECGEPKVARWGSSASIAGGGEGQFPDAFDADIVKSSAWISSDVTGEESRWYVINILKIKISPRGPAAIRPSASVDTPRARPLGSTSRCGSNTSSRGWESRESFAISPKRHDLRSMTSPGSTSRSEDWPDSAFRRPLPPPIWRGWADGSRATS